MQELHIWSALLEFLDCRCVGVHPRTADHHAGLCADRERDGVRRVSRREDFVTRPLQQNFQVRKKIKRGIEANNSGGGCVRRFFRSLRPRGKCFDRFFLRCVRAEHLEQVGGLKDLNDKWRQFAKLEIASVRSKDAEDANQRSQATAIHIRHFGELQNDVLREVGLLFQLELKEAYLVATDDAATASHNDDVAYVLSLQSQLHGGDKPITFRASVKFFGNGKRREVRPRKSGQKAGTHRRDAEGAEREEKSVRLTTEDTKSAQSARRNP